MHYKLTLDSYISEFKPIKLSPLKLELHEIYLAEFQFQISTNIVRK